MQEKTNLTGASVSPEGTFSRRLRGLFYGPSELRAGWRFLIFAAIVMSLLAVKTVFIRLLPHGTNQATTYLVDKTLKFAVFLLASWIMAKVEARTIADYGLPRRKMFGQQFWQGAVLAFVCLTGFLIALRIGGLFRFGEISLHGLAIWKWAALYSIGFIIAAFGGRIPLPWLRHSAQSQIESARRQLTRFEMRAVAQNDYPVERQARFRAIPINEFIDRVTIPALCVRRSEATQDRGFSMFEI